MLSRITRYCFSRKISGWLFLILTTIGIIRALQHNYIADANESVQFGLS
jgi:hypothetical protein